jgi:hypothetical protein
MMKIPDPKEPEYHVHEIHRPRDVAEAWTAFHVAFGAEGLRIVALAQ